MKTKSLLLLLGAIVLSTTNVHAADTSETATQVLEAVLDSYANITVDNDILQKKIDPQTGVLDSNYTTVYTIEANDTASLELYAKTVIDGGASVDAFFKGSDDKVYVILSHTTKQPSADAISNIQGTPVGASNQNAIAYPVTNIELDGPILTDLNFDATAKKYTFQVDSGKTTATTTISNTPLSNTYSYDDQAGTYQATVTLTKVST